MTLTEAALFTKRFLIFGILGLVLLITGFVSFRAYQNYIKSKTPPPEEQPKADFGILPKPKLIEGTISTQNFTYTLNTKTGKLPDKLPKIMKVFYIPQLITTLLAPERAKELATNLKFNTNPEILSEVEYRFADEEDNKLVANLTTGNFYYVRQVATDSATLKDDLLPTKDIIEKEFKSFLSNKSLLKEELKTGKVEINYDKKNQADSETATISLWQGDIEDTPIVTSLYKEGLINGEVTKFRDEKYRFIKLDYIYWPIDQNNFSTYPIKTADAAFSDLNNGAASLVIEPLNPQVSISNVYLAYLLSTEYSPYLEPVYVFEGEDFVAYVSAIKSDFLEKD